MSEKYYNFCLNNACAAIFFLSPLAFADAIAETAQAEETSEPILEEVRVVGIRNTLEKNLEIKRYSSAFVDAITSEDIGKFPDKNVADALQRVPGISIIRSGGEGQFVSIRGTSSALTLTQLNGNYVATGSTSRNPQRSFNYAMLPANLIQKTEVYKSPQAKLDEGGVGGTIIVHTRKPLDTAANIGFLNIEETYADVTEKYEPQYSALYSWKNESETFGVLASFVAQDRTVITEGLSTENWRLFDDSRVGENNFVAPSLVDTAGNKIVGYAPFAVIQNYSQAQRDRQGYQLTMQWRPTDKLTTTFNYMGTSLDQTSDSNMMTLAEWDYTDPAIVPGSVRYDGETIVAMELADKDLNDHTVDLKAPAIGSRRSISEAKSDTYDLEMVYEGDFYTASVNLGYTNAKGGQDFNEIQRFNGQQGVTSAYGWNLNSRPVIHYDADPTDFNTFGFSASDPGTSADSESYFQVDVNLEQELGIFHSFDVGAKYRDHEVEQVYTKLYWDDGDPDNGNTGEDGESGYAYWHTISNLPTTAEVASFTQYVNGLTGKAGTEASFLTLDWDRYIEWLDTNFTRNRLSEDGNFLRVTEKITAAYVQGNFEVNNLSGNLGIRAVQTAQTSQGFNTAKGVVVGGLQVSKGDYTDLLPSFNLKWDITEHFLLRAAVAQVISRVSYGRLKISESFNAPPEGSNNTTGSRGNTDLKPYDANQYDLGVEWYFKSSSVLGATIFHKQIDSFVTSIQVSEQRNISSRPNPVNVLFSVPVNGTNATSTGLELFYQQSFNFGGGIIANYTYTDTSLATLETDGKKTKTPLPGTSKYQYNLSAYYERDKFNLRASYNYRDDYAVEQTTGKTVYTDGYGQLDLNASYKLTEAFTLSAAVINVTKEVNSAYWGSEERLYSLSYPGRRFYLGVNYTL
ncbi:MAG: TonB-dependent receptor [Gammaproteobacteria bacterium]|nr:TonB-dependent receptor [Gammaproteobacteria bacterium]